jgi:hypothetical protein
MAWLHVRIWNGRLIGGAVPSVIEDIWRRCPRTPFIRKIAAEEVRKLGFEVAPLGHPDYWREFPLEVSAFLCMKRGGGRAGSSIETMACRRGAR